MSEKRNNRDNKPKSLADAVGLPDDEDKLNIMALIEKYNKKQPGKLAHTIASAKKEHEKAGHGDFIVTDTHSQTRQIFELPEDFVSELEKAYPLMFKDKKHFQWFVKNFKMLMIPKKY